MIIKPNPNPHPYPHYADGRSILGPRHGKPGCEKFKPHHIADDPHQVRRMNLDDCTIFLARSDVYRKQKITYPKTGRTIELKPVRELVQQRAKDIKRAVREIELYRKFIYHIEDVHARTIASAALIANDVLKYGWNAEAVDGRLQVAGTNSRNIVFDTVNVVTGLYSVKAYELLIKNPKYELTPEHFHPRTKSGEEITYVAARKIVSGEEFTLTDFLHHLYTRCFVTYTTSDENNRLRTYTTKHPNCTPDEAYRACGITLVRVSEPSIAWQWEQVFDHYNLPIPETELPNFDIIAIDEVAKKVPPLQVVTS